MEVLHVEVARNPTSHLKTADVVKLLQEAIEHLENPVRDFCINDGKNSNLKSHVHSIKFCSASTTYRTVKASSRALERAGARDYGCNGYRSHSKIEYHIFKLNEEGENAEFVEDEDDDGQSPSSHHWILPSQAYHDLWDSLIFKSDIKTRLIDYIKTAMLYSEKMVSESLISWNKIILLHGPPGTGKTSLCKALAHKATIRLGSRFDYGQLIEINSHSLFSKWFSESGKLVTKMFEKVQELIEDPHSIVFLLIDEVESLAQCRTSALNGNEPSDSIRAVNALLTQIDRIKKYPNVVILATSNIVGSIDLAFIDRADMKIFIGNPPADIIYEILASSINELLRVGIVSSENNIFLPTTQRDIEVHTPAYNAAHQLLKISKQAINMSGRTLRKIPFLTHVNFVGQDYCNLDQFLISMERAVKAEKNELETLDTKYFLRSQKSNEEADVPEIIGIFEPGTSASAATSGRSRISRIQPSMGEESSTQSISASSGRQIGRPRKTFIKPNVKNSSSKYYQETPINEPMTPRSKATKAAEETPKNEVQNRKKSLPEKEGPCPRSKKKGLTTPPVNDVTVDSAKSRCGNSNSENKSEVVDGIRLRSTKVVHPLHDSVDSDDDGIQQKQRQDLEENEVEVIPSVKSSRSPRSNRKSHAVIRTCFVDLSKSICDPHIVKSIIQRQSTKQPNTKNLHSTLVTTASKGKAVEPPVSSECEKKMRYSKDSITLKDDVSEGTVTVLRPFPSTSPRLPLPEIHVNNNPTPPNSCESRKNSKSPDVNLSSKLAESVTKSRPVSSVKQAAISVKAEPPDINVVKKACSSPKSSMPEKKPTPTLKIVPKLEPVDKDKGHKGISKNPTAKTVVASTIPVKPNILSKTNTNKTATTLSQPQPTVAITKIDPGSRSNSNSNSISTGINVCKPDNFSSNSNSAMKSLAPVPTTTFSPQQQQSNNTATSNLSKIVAVSSSESNHSSSKAVTSSITLDSNNTQKSLLPTPPLTPAPAPAPASTTINSKLQQPSPTPKNQLSKSQNEKVTENVGFISNSTFRPSASYNHNVPRISTSAVTTAENTPKFENTRNGTKLIRVNSDNSNGSGHASNPKRPRLTASSDRPPLDIIDLEENESISQSNSTSSNFTPKGKLFSSGPSSIASSIASSPEPDTRFSIGGKQPTSGNLSNKGKKTSFVCDICDKGFKLKRELNAHNSLIHGEVNRFLCHQCDKTFAKTDYLKKHLIRCKGTKSDPGQPPNNTKVQMDGNRLIFKTVSPALSNNNSKIANSNLTSRAGNGVEKNNYYQKQSKFVSTGNASGIGTLIQDEEFSPASSYTTSPASVKSGSVASVGNLRPVGNIGSPCNLDAASNQKLGVKFNCNDCDETFNTEKLLQRHSIVHQDERPFTCPICAKAFKTEKSLKFHDRLSHKTHSETEHYACSICGLVFDSEEEVEEHEGKEHDSNARSYQNANNNSRLMVPMSMGSTNTNNSVNSMDIFPNDPHTPYSHAATELSSSVSSILSNSSDCDQLGGFYGGTGGGCRTPYSETSTVESTAITVSSMDTVLSDSHSFNPHFSSGSVLDSLDFPLGDDYRNCNICGECFLGEYELTQHKQIFHQNSIPEQLPEIPSDVVGCFMNDAAISSVPVPDAETIIEVETSDEFLSFLNAF